MIHLLSLKQNFHFKIFYNVEKSSIYSIPNSSLIIRREMLLIWVLSLMYIKFCWLFNAKVILVEGQYWYYLTHSWRDKDVHKFLKGISMKVNIIARLELDSLCYSPVC